MATINEQNITPLSPDTSAILVMKDGLTQWMSPRKAWEHQVEVSDRLNKELLNEKAVHMETTKRLANATHEAQGARSERDWADEKIDLWMRETNQWRDEWDHLQMLIREAAVNDEIDYEEDCITEEKSVGTEKRALDAEKLHAKAAAKASREVWEEENPGKKYNAMEILDELIRTELTPEIPHMFLPGTDPMWQHLSPEQVDENYDHTMTTYTTTDGGISVPDTVVLKDSAGTFAIPKELTKGYEMDNRQPMDRGILHMVALNQRATCLEEKLLKTRERIKEQAQAGQMYFTVWTPSFSTLDLDGKIDPMELVQALANEVYITYKRSRNHGGINGVFVNLARKPRGKGGLIRRLGRAVFPGVKMAAVAGGAVLGAEYGPEALDFLMGLGS